MAIDRNDPGERQRRINAMLEEFRAAQQRRLVKRGVSFWNRIEAAHQATMLPEPVPPDKLN